MEYKIKFYLDNGSPSLQETEIKEFDCEDDAVQYARQEKDSREYAFYSVREVEIYDY